MGRVAGFNGLPGPAERNGKLRAGATLQTINGVTIDAMEAEALGGAEGEARRLAAASIGTSGDGAGAGAGAGGEAPGRLRSETQQQGGDDDDGVGTAEKAKELPTALVDRYKRLLQRVKDAARPVTLGFTQPPVKQAAAAGEAKGEAKDGDAGAAGAAGDAGEAGKTVAVVEEVVDVEFTAGPLGIKFGPDPSGNMAIESFPQFMGPVEGACLIDGGLLGAGGYRC